MNILVDMNLSPEWVSIFQQHGHESVHWTKVGDKNAPDTEILLWAKENGYVIFTHDLDFCAIIAATGADSPSVLQLRAQDITPGNAENVLLDAISKFEKYIDAGALISIDMENSRARLLPLK